MSFSASKPKGLPRLGYPSGETLLRIKRIVRLFDQGLRDSLMRSFSDPQTFAPRYGAKP